MLQRLRRKVLQHALAIAFRPSADRPVELLGSSYGGWIIPVQEFTADSICYSFGAGEDLSFDLELADRCGCAVHVFDPTPRAHAHFENLRKAASQKHPSPAATFNIYPQKHIDAIKRVHFHQVGLWIQDGEAEFYAPEDPTHISHSLTGIQSTSEGFLGKVKTLPSIKASLGHARIDLLKADIEGAELEVLEQVIAKQIFPRVLCVEFDAVAHGGLRETLRLFRLISRLRHQGYCLLHIDRWNYTFARTH